MNSTSTYKTLKLNLNYGWFDMILSGHKPEEYRIIKPYWINRLIKFNRKLEPTKYMDFCEDLANPNGIRYPLEGLFNFYDCEFKKWDDIEFYKGYSKNRPTAKYAFEKIEIRKGNYLWGCPKVPVFVITLGKELSRTNC